MECRQPVWFGRLADQVHTGVVRRAAAFPVIAAEARSDNIVPAFLSTHRYWNDVIERQVFGWKLLPAVLTRVIVTRVDVRARKLDAVQVPHTDVFEEANDRRQLDGERDGMDLLIVFVNDFDFPGEQQSQRFFPGNDAKRLVRSIQKKRRVHPKGDFSD